MGKVNFKYVVFAILMIYIVINLIFQYLIKIRKIKPTKLSRIFYTDDESFIIYWEPIKEKGMFRYFVKTIIMHTTVMGIIGVALTLNQISILRYDQKQTILTALLIGIILGIINALIDWCFNNDRYFKLK